MAQKRGPDEEKSDFEFLTIQVYLTVTSNNTIPQLMKPY
jgi:hypothetical protein